MCVTNAPLIRPRYKRGRAGNGKRFSFWKFFVVTTVAFISIILQEALEYDTHLITFILCLIAVMFVSYIGFIISKIAYFEN